MVFSFPLKSKFEYNLLLPVINYKYFSRVGEQKKTLEAISKVFWIVIFDYETIGFSKANGNAFVTY